MDHKSVHLILFFTWDVSLAVWKSKGLLEREVRYYEELANKGTRITFLTWGNEEDLQIAKELHKSINVIPLYMHIPHPGNKALRALLSVFAPWAARKSIKTADLFKTNQMWGGWCAVLAKLIFRKPLIVRTGFELYNFTIQQGHGILRRNFIRFLSAFTYKAADVVYLATSEDRDFVIQKFGIPADKISIRPNWIDTEKFKPVNTPEKENHLLFVGRLTKQKNLKQLIDAVADSPWVLDLVGEGEMREELEQYANAKGAHLNFLGSVPNDQLPEFYNRYPVFILPSLYEGNPKTLLEAMACGCAVIGTDAVGIRSVIEDGQTGLLCPLAASALRDAINTLFSDADLRRVLGERARKQIKETQALEKLVDKELADYYDLADYKEETG